MNTTGIVDFSFIKESFQICDLLYKEPKKKETSRVISKLQETPSGVTVDTKRERMAN